MMFAVFSRRGAESISNSQLSLSFLIFHFFLNWTIVALQCGVSFCSTTKRISYIVVVQSPSGFLILYDPMDCSRPGLPVVTIS